MSVPPAIDGPATVITVEPFYPADDGCHFAATREWIWDADQWELAEEGDGTTALTFQPCQRVVNIYPPSLPPTTISTATTTTITLPKTGSSIEFTQGMMRGGLLIFVVGLIAVVGAARRNRPNVESN